jgi:uncharacterized FlgJ-related protein
LFIKITPNADTILFTASSSSSAMSSLVSEALAGLSEGLSDEAAKSAKDMTSDQIQAKHRCFLAEIIPKIQKIQREMRGRRFKVSSV